MSRQVKGLRTLRDAVRHFGVENISQLPGFREELSATAFQRWDDEADNPDWDPNDEDSYQTGAYVPCDMGHPDATPMLGWRFAQEIEAFLRGN
ncbi:MAG: hypothetical protein ACRDJ1_04275 [Actinomycetota bacterium]